MENFVTIITSAFKLLYWYLEAFYRLFIPPPLKSINGETILVTGAAGGIGSEICRNLVKNGSNLKLVLWDVNLPALESLAEELKAIGERNGIFCYEVDVSRKENIKECSRRAKDDVGEISIIFNNAGIARVSNFLLQTDQDIEDTIQINLMSHFWIIREFLPGMVMRNHGRIINISSAGGLMATVNILPYIATKFAVNGYTESMKMELEMSKCDGIHMTTVYPYMVKTPLIKSLEWDIKSESSLNNVLNPLKYFFDVEEVGKGIVEGMRREYEYIYFPKTIPMIILLLEFLLPTKAKKALQLAGSTKSFVFRDEADQAIYYTSYRDVVKNWNENKH